MAADGRPPWWQRFTTVRARTTAAATVVVGLAIAVIAAGLVLMLRRSLVDQVDEIAEARAGDIAALARQNTLPRVLAGETDATDMAQVVDDEGRILAGTPGVASEVRIAGFRPTGSEARARTVRDATRSGGVDYRVVALPANTPSGPVTVYVASNLDPVNETIALLRNAISVGAPVLLVLVAATTWAVVGRALHPVEAIRSQVAHISNSSLDQRVPVPSTGDEVSRLAATMNTMLDRLHAATQRQRRFVADASHELQTPLSAVGTDLEVALAHPDDTRWPEIAADVLATNRRMERLVRDLLFLARSDEAALRATAVPVDLDDIVLAEAARIRTGTRIRLDTSRVSAAAALGRRDELLRAVGNVLDNAARHCSSVVTIELSSDASTVTLAVQDDGSGIDPSDRERVFERFTRLDEARSRARGGAGLGLAIAREIIQRHGGRIVVDGGQPGARFVIRLPAA
jgi:signal transduction histidine kinase